MLIVFGGLPGTGKTTLARAVAVERNAVYLRIDTIEQSLRRSGVLADEVGAAGYQIAYALAEENLCLGRTVVADAANVQAAARASWRAIAAATFVPIVEVELVCSNPEEHRRRLERRIIDIPGLNGPTWQQVVERERDDWDGPHLVFDTAGQVPAASLTQLRGRLESWIAGAPAV